MADSVARAQGPGFRSRVRESWQLIRRYLPLWKSERKVLAVAGALLALEMPLSIVTPLLMRQIFDVALPSGDISLVIRFCGLIVLTALASRLMLAVQNLLTARAHLRFSRRLRLRLFRHFLRLDAAYFHDKDTGYLVSRQVDDVNNLDGIMADTFLRAVVESGRLLVYVVVLFLLEPVLSLTGLLFVGGVLVMNLLLSQPLRRTAHQSRETWSATSALLYEAMSGQSLVRAAAAETHVRRGYASRLIAHLRARFRNDLLGILSDRLAGVIDALGLSLTLLVGVWRILEGQFTIGGMFAFYVFLVNMFGVVRTLSSLNPSLQRALASAARIAQVLDTEPSVCDRPASRPIEIHRGGVRFEQVSFSYLAGRPVLREIDLEARPGETIALVGPSGAGKTTLVSLLPRFFDVTAGRVSIDGEDVRDFRLRSLRRQIGIVPQDIFLLNRSVRDNLTFGLDGRRRQVTQAEIEAAARSANAHQFISELPAGYDTLIGERGLKLSGGEKQRLAIARELLRNPRLMILDEATSSLDSESERLVQEALERLRQDRTTFVIAHRLSTVLAADQIVVLDQGRVVARGRHESLLAGSPLYRRLYQTQFKPLAEGAGDLTSNEAAPDQAATDEAPRAVLAGVGP